MTITKLDDAKRNLKVMRLQDALNDNVRHTLEGKVLYNSVKDYIPEFCQWVKSHPAYSEFQDLKISELVDVWESVAILKVSVLKDAIKIMEADISGANDDD